MSEHRIGTCTWNYPSWEGLVYQTHDKTAYLAEYAKQYNAVEIDRWFWSLFDDPMKIRLPLPRDAAAYRASVPDDFQFGIKVPNSITLTHLYKKDRSSRSEPLQTNPHFLSNELMLDFLDRIEPLHDVMGPVMFQFEYLNKAKMPSAREFIARFSAFSDHLPEAFTYALETRNKNYLNEAWLEFLLEHGISPVLISGYWMPHIADFYAQYKHRLLQFPQVIIRLMGEERGEIEKTTGERWNTIVKPHDRELDDVATILLELQRSGVQPFVFVNNHYEGSAPITIDRLMERLNA